MIPKGFSPQFSRTVSSTLSAMDDVCVVDVPSAIMNLLAAVFSIPLRSTIVMLCPLRFRIPSIIRSPMASVVVMYVMDVFLTFSKYSEFGAILPAFM